MKADAIESPATGAYVNRFLSGGPRSLADDEDPDDVCGSEIPQQEPHDGTAFMGRPVPGGEWTWSPAEVPEVPWQEDGAHHNDEMEEAADNLPPDDEMGSPGEEEGEPIEITVETADLEVEGLAPPLPPPDAPPSDVEEGSELPPHLEEIPTPPPVPASRLLMPPPAPPRGSILAFFVITCFLYFRLGVGWNALIRTGIQ